MNNILVTNEKDLEILKGIKKEVLDTIPSKYIPLTLCSKGKLGKPEIIHVRNFTTEELLELAIQKGDNLLISVINIVANLIYEDVAKEILTNDEIIQILLHIFLNFWNTHLQEWVFPIDEEDIKFLKENKPQLYDTYKRKEYKPTTSISIKKLDFTDMVEEFKEPFTLYNKDKTINASFQLAKTYHAVIANKHIEKKFYEDNEKLNDLRNDKDFKELTPEDKHWVIQLQSKQAQELVKIMQVQLIVKLNGKDVSSIEEQLEAWNLIDPIIWERHKKVIEKYPYGIVKDIKVKNPITKKTVIRRFQFRLLSILSAFTIPADDEFDIGFD